MDISISDLDNEIISKVAVTTADNSYLFEKPTFVGGVQYDGTLKSVEDYLDGYYSNYMRLSGATTGIDAGKYLVTVTLVDGAWADGTTSSKFIEWEIQPATLYILWDKWEFMCDGVSVSAFAPQISNLIGLVGSDSFNYKTDFIYRIYDDGGNLLNVSEVSDIGSYKITASFSGTVKNYTLDSTTNEWSFVVVPGWGMQILTIEWSDTEFLYDGEIHYPRPTIRDINGNVVTADVMAYLKFSEGYNMHSDIGTYSVQVTVKDSFANEYFIRMGSTCKFKIVDLNGYAPDEALGPDNSPSNGGDLGELEVSVGSSAIFGMTSGALIACIVGVLLSIILFVFFFTFFIHI